MKPTQWSSLTEYMALFAVLCGFAVVGLRWQAATTAALHTPGTAQTSGCEEESWFTLWNKLHGNPVFRDVRTPPYNFAYFNWGFYEIYGRALKLAGAETHPDRIISVGRTLSLMFGLCGFTLLAIASLRLFPSLRGRPGTRMFWSSLPFAGPITGWFIVTVRPDVAALFFEAGALCVFLLIRPKHRTTGLLLAGLCGFAAWSLKTSYVGALCTIGIFLILRRNWRDLVRFCLPVFAMMAASLLIGGEWYRGALFGATFGQSEFAIEVGTAVFKQFLLVGAPLLAGIGLALGLKWWPGVDEMKSILPEPDRPRKDTIHLSAIGTVFVGLMMGAASFKQGAWVNYYMPVTVPATMLVIALSAHSRAPWVPTFVASIITVILQAGMLGGAWGKINLDDANADLDRKWQVYASQPEPRFSRDLRLNLPWLNPNSTPYILAYNYPFLREAGLPFEGDGVGGAIKRGELNSLLLPAETQSEYDGASLSDFTRKDEFSGWSLFVRRSRARPHQQTALP